LFTGNNRPTQSVTGQQIIEVGLSAGLNETLLLSSGA
jgi:hypothetical protein